jgi:hypothetical protein
VQLRAKAEAEERHASEVLSRSRDVGATRDAMREQAQLVSRQQQQIGVLQLKVQRLQQCRLHA